MSVAFEELEGSPRLEIGADGARATRSFRVAWDDWLEFARLLVGQYVVVGGEFTFVPPLPFPGWPSLLVAELSVEPMEPGDPDALPLASPGSGTNRYTLCGARITARYEMQWEAVGRQRAELPQVPAGTYLTFEADLGAEHVPTPGRTWRWNVPPDFPPVPDDVQPGVLLPYGALRLVWHRVPLPPWDTIRALRGAVNATAFAGAPAGTVLFLGARARRQFQFLDDGGFWRLEYHFLENARPRAGGELVGWNYFYREQGVQGEHWIDIHDEDGRPPYRTAELHQLFTFG
jgi:hypothetical protein